MSVVLDQYAERLRRKRKSVYSMRNFDVVSRRFERWLSAQGITAESVTYEALEEYIDGLNLSPSSKSQHLRWIQAAYNYAIKRGTIRHNPALDIDVEQEPDSEPRVIAPYELRAIRDGLYWERDVVFFHLLAYTGMRRAEIRGLRWEEVDDSSSVVRLEEETLRVLGKGGKMRLVPIHPALGEVLSELKPKNKYVISSRGQHGVALDTIQAMSRRLHPTYTPHDYRRSVATSLRRNGVDTGVIDRIMGWAPRSVFRRYYDNVAGVELKRAILKLYADDPV